LIRGQVLYDENHGLGRREYIETELPLALKKIKNNNEVSSPRRGLF